MNRRRFDTIPRLLFLFFSSQTHGLEIYAGFKSHLCDTILVTGLNHGNWRAVGVTGVGHAFLHSDRVLVSPRSRKEATFKGHRNSASLC
ncbi:hypothetical protein EDB82DRAFT_110689 [Fusarium venenatum]|uniref:uncharacterized protein n=1 Tax=Fusarium venenatum TaxID=56646 RepID=UPI001DB96496|nr:hypothetical protein EDB82DRAFT_110689 [Fusarium venenatum]